MIKSLFFCIKKKKYLGLLSFTEFDFKQILHENLFKCSNKKVIEHVMSNAKNLEYRGMYEWRAIHYACVWNNLEFVKELVEQKVDLEAMDHEKNRPIHLACQYGSKELVEVLIDAGVKLECFNIRKEKPIHIAFYNKDLSVAKLLVNRDVSLNSVNINKHTPIHLACDRCMNLTDTKQNLILTKIVKRMLKKKINVDLPGGESGDYPIHLSIQRQNLDLVELLVNSTIDLEAKNAANQRPLHLVCMLKINESSINILKLLVNDAQVNLECKDIEGKRPIHYACLNECDSLKFVKILHKADANLNKGDEFGKKPIDYAEESCNTDLVNFLSKKILLHKN